MFQYIHIMCQPLIGRFFGVASFLDFSAFLFRIWGRLFQYTFRLYPLPLTNSKNTAVPTNLVMLGHKKIWSAKCIWSYDRTSFTLTHVIHAFCRSNTWNSCRELFLRFLLNIPTPLRRRGDGAPLNPYQRWMHTLCMPYKSAARNRLLWW